MKKIISLLLLLALCLALCACGGESYGVKTIQTLVEQDYSIAFRTGDNVYYYVTAAISELAYEGKVEELSRKWFGSSIVTFHQEADALSKFTPPESRVLRIGIDINSFPVAYLMNGVYWGYDIELAMAACEKLGWELQIQPIDAEEVYIELSSGNIDCAWGGIVLDADELAAEKYMQYGPYLHNDIVVAARDGSSVWNQLKLNGRNMAMCSTPEAMAALETDEGLMKRLGQITRLAGGTVECFEYLYSGKCDAVLTDSTALYYYNCH